MKIAYIDHSFHQKTKSTLFLVSLFLSKNHTVINFWDDSWQNNNHLNIDEINNGNFDLIIFFQSIPHYTEIYKLKCRNIIWIPMYDGDRSRNIFEWLSYLICDIKIISFSKTLSKIITKFKFDILNVQYYPKPNLTNKNLEGINIFFWERIPKINWELIKKLIGKNKISKIYLRSIMDNNNKEQATSSLLKDEDIRKYNIKIINGWLKKDTYEEILKSCNIYIAPRQFEGIGMSFLEAMSLGIPVIAPDSATMNEYIINNKNGFLYNINKPKPIDFSNLNKIRKNLAIDIVRGLSVWEEQQNSILNFIEKPTPKIDPLAKSLILIIVIIYYSILKPSKLFKKMIKRLITK